MLSPFGVEHPISKSKGSDAVAAGTGAAVGGFAAPSVYQLAHAGMAARHLSAGRKHVARADRAHPHGDAHRLIAEHEVAAAKKSVRRARSVPLRRGAGVAGAAAGAVGAVALSRAALPGVHKSAFGVEYPVSKAVRLDRALEAARKPAKVKLASVKTPLADARFGPVKKGAGSVVDDALVAPARVRVAGRPQKQAPPAEAKPARPPGQRLNNAIAATGGPSS